MNITRKVTFAATPAALAAFAVALSSMPATPALAEAAAQGDPGVARVSAISGGVSVRRGDSKDAFAAAQNAPVSVGDYLSTENAARAEVEFDYGSLVRVAPQTQLRFVKLDPQAHELQLAEGTVEMRVLHGLDAHPVVDTPAASIVPDSEGRYRVTVTHDGNTLVTVRSGKADVEYGNSEQRTVTPGTTVLLTGQGNDTHISNVLAVAYDDFDRWADARDSHYANGPDSAYTDRGMIGANDLDQYGHWVDSADYGQGWQPSDEPAGWAPYTDGRWVWEPYYGWTWVGDEPWGYAPYHYGRWLFTNGAWSWFPGTYDGEPYAYSPALVGFFGWGDGGGLNINFDFGNIGWTPLAPFEAYRPWWGDGGGTTIVNNYYGGSGGSGGYGGYGRGGHGNSGQGNGSGYRNVTSPGGANGVSNGSFASGNFEHIQPVLGNLLKGIKPVIGAVPVMPTGSALAFNGNAPKPLGGITPISERFKSLAPIARAVPTFEQQRSAIASTIKQQLPGLTNVLGAGERTTTGAGPADRGENNDVRPAGEDRVIGSDRVNGSEHPPTDGASNATAWERFDTGRNSGASRLGALPETERATTDTLRTDRNPNSAPDSARTNEHFDGQPSGAPRENDAWSRFGPSSNGRTTNGNVSPARSDEPSYAIRSNSGVERTTSDTEHSFSQPMHSFSDTGHSYSEPSHSYSEPSRSYSEPSRSYSEPSRSYSEPSRSYSEPSRSFSQPSRSYSAPSRSYSAPSRSYSAPPSRSYSASRSSSGGSHSSSDHSSKHR
jgi:hypothetical protein